MEKIENAGQVIAESTTESASGSRPSAPSLLTGTSPDTTQNLIWYLPTFHGDIQLEAKGEKETRLHAFELTPTEMEAMKALRARALQKTRLGFKVEPWASDRDFLALASPSYRDKDGLTITLRASIEDVQSVLAKALKPNRKLLSAVMFANGKMAEVRMVRDQEGSKKAFGLTRSQEREAKIIQDEKEALIEKEKALAKEKAAIEKEKEKAIEKVKPKAAVTVAPPTIGCPSPEFEEAEIRADRVLDVFLTPEQRRDYLRYGAFVATGADTGHRYAITHRERPKMMRLRQSRSLFDIDENRPLCVHDWTVPAPEEMLGLLLCITLPGHENKIRWMPETWSH